MTLIYESQDAVGSAAGTMFVTTKNGTTWTTNPAPLMGAGSDYVADVYGKLGSNGSPDLLAYNGFVFLQAYAGQPTLFVYKVSTQGSKPFGAEPGSTGLTPVGVALYKHNVYFNGMDVNGAQQLYEIASKTGSIGSSTRLSDFGIQPINPPGAPGNPAYMVEYNGSLYMNAVDANNLNRLFAYNGTFQGPFAGEDENERPPQGENAGGFNPTGLAVGGGGKYLFMNGVDSHKDKCVYVWGPSSAAPKKGAAKDPIDILVLPSLVSINNQNKAVAYFSGVADSAGNRILYRTIANPDGTSSTEPVKHVEEGRVHNLDPYNLTLIDKNLFFTGNKDNSGNKRALFVLDTNENTYKEVGAALDYNCLYDNAYNPGWRDQNPTTLTATGGALYFGAVKAGDLVPQVYELTISGSSFHVKPVTSNYPSAVGLAPVSLTHV